MPRSFPFPTGQIIPEELSSTPAFWNGTNKPCRLLLRKPDSCPRYEAPSKTQRRGELEVGY